MVGLYIYIGTTLLSIGTAYLVSKSCDKEAENMGYKWKKGKKNIYKSIIDNIKAYGFFCIPFVNIAFSVILFFKADDFIKEIIDEAIKKGNLVKMEEVPKIIETVEVDNNLVQNSKVVVYKVDNEQKKEITREEKLEFLKQEYERLTGEELTNNVNQKRYGIGKRRR